MKFAVIKTGGKQYRVSEGDVITVERLENPQSELVTFSEVLLMADGDVVTIGKPLVSGMTVSGVVIEHPKGEKIRVSQYKAKARFRRVNGHRQALTTVRIDMIGNTKVSGVSKAEVVKEDTVSTMTPPVKKPARAKKAE